jgi:hypothetical protein
MTPETRLVPCWKFLDMGVVVGFFPPTTSPRGEVCDPSETRHAWVYNDAGSLEHSYRITLMY